MRNPWVFFRLRLFGWYVRFTRSSDRLWRLGALSERPPSIPTGGPDHPGEGRTQARLRSREPRARLWKKVVNTPRTGCPPPSTRGYNPARFPPRFLGPDPSPGQAREVSTTVESDCGQMSFPLSERGSGSGSAVDSPEQRACAAVLERARRDLPEAAFEMWFAGLAPGKVRGDVVELLTPSPYVRTWLSGHYMDLIAASVATALGPEARVRLRAAPSGPPASGGSDPSAGDPDRKPPHDQLTLDRVLDGSSSLPDRYTFESFVPGPSNKFAHAAALAVAEAPPSTAYNPLFVYGESGLGKTHLLVAIAHHMATLAPRTRIRYVTSESFVTEFIKSVRERRGYQFQRQYRDVDVLLLDDVQFLGRAEETQTEFFHTFNHLHQHERQIVIASDRPPQELGG
ncbi:MAG TPA: DnaA/Hda family protein, partial [Actinomycetota bacterium]